MSKISKMIFNTNIPQLILTLQFVFFCSTFENNASPKYFTLFYFRIQTKEKSSGKKKEKLVKVPVAAISEISTIYPEIAFSYILKKTSFFLFATMLILEQLQ